MCCKISVQKHYFRFNNAFGSFNLLIKNKKIKNKERECVLLWQDMEKKSSLIQWQS